MSKPEPRVRLERPSARRERDYLTAALRSRALHRGYVVAASAPREAAPPARRAEAPVRAFRTAGNTALAEVVEAEAKDDWAEF